MVDTILPSSDLQINTDNLSVNVMELFGPRVAVIGEEIFTSTRLDLLKVRAGTTINEIMTRLESAVGELHRNYEMPVNLCLDFSYNNDAWFLTQPLLQEIIALADFCKREKVGSITVRLPEEIKINTYFNPIQILGQRRMIEGKGNSPSTEH